MIDEKILDEILPVPTIEELKEEKIQELKNEGFVITNFNSGSVFNILLMTVFKVRIELVKLLRNVLNNMFISYSSGIWLELKAADFSKKKKKAQKTKGYITLKRNISGETVKISKATVFKTQKDINGDELRFFSLDDAVLRMDETSIAVLVEAEKAGANYNVPVGQITRSLTYIESIDSINNEANWIIQEGSDVEDDESLRSRILNSWSELSARPIAAKYKNVCEAVEGVLFVNVDDLHPRGQGTIDIIVTGAAGQATESLLNNVKAAAESIAGEYDNILVKSSVTVQQNISIVITLYDGESDENVITNTKTIITDLFKISKQRKLNELLRIDILTELKNRIPSIKNVKFIIPTDDVILDIGKVIILGEITVTIQGA